ncbi:hypothetical protein OUZ56_029070 [Daphnia magna]|uniref:SESTD1-like spectrin repeats region domain-containing protein n=1 Tax=Daphnia magna TaxID=35525 RepID=A0ABR0B5R6_9CRUS|nr:hypothetical protein OUZ56_029070 [Daphnia magna]
MATTRDIESELKRRVAYLPGGRDRSGQPLIVVPIDPPPAGLCGAGGAVGSSASTTANNNNNNNSRAPNQHGRELNDSFDSDSRLMTRGEEERCQDLDRVLRYLLPIALGSSTTKSVVVLMDARQGCWRLLRASTEQVQITLANHLAAVWALKPEPFWEKQHVECVKSRQDCKIQYMSLSKLHKFVDLDQLPEELGGQLPYQHKQWVKNRLRMETFGKRSQMILANLSEVRGQLERGCELQKSDGGFRMIDWMVSLGTLYRNCLANVRKVEQNGRKLYKQLETDEESGFRLARTDGSVTEYTTQCQRLVQEALAGIRGRVGEAEQLYAELQCGIQHAREIRRLEAGVEAVTGWVLGPGADLLRQLILRGIGQDPDSVLVLQQELEHLELKCRDTYAKYAEVRHRLGFLFRSRCILPSDIKPRRSFMDSVCRTFAGLLERRRRVLITSYKFHRLLAEFHVKLADALRAVQSSEVGEDPTKAEGAMNMLDEFQQSIDGLCGEVESEAQRLLDLLVLPPRDAVGRELQGYDHRRERQHVQFFLRRVQDGQGRLQHAWSMERLRLRRIIEISTCERDSQQALAWLGDLCNVMKTSRGRVGCNQTEVQVLKQQQSKFQETARGAYEYGMGLLMAALVLRRSASLSPDRNRQLAAMLGSVWNRLLAAIREQMTRLRVAGLFYRDIAQHEADLNDLVNSESETKWTKENGGDSPDAEQVFRTLGRTVRLGRLLQRKILEPLLPGEGFDGCPENQQAVQVISERISCVTDLAHRLDVALGNRTDSYVDTYIMDDSVFDMEEIDVEVGFEESENISPDSSPKDEDASKSSCYQSASSNCSWNSLSPGRNIVSKTLEQLDMKPMDDFRDYVNFTPTPSKLFLQTCTPSSGVGSSTSGGSIGGLSPNSSEDSGFGTGLRVYNGSGSSKLFVKPDEPIATNADTTTSVDKSMNKMDDLLGGSRFRSSICYARSASCDSLF